ncbi:unnamed protein product [Closterium sp. NIES-64]|nr:unnamed protein product [Closterium sp. NIES-64]
MQHLLTPSPSLPSSRPPLRSPPHALPFAPLLTPSPSLPSSRPPLRSPPHALPFAPLLTPSPSLPSSRSPLRYAPVLLPHPFLSPSFPPPFSLLLLAPFPPLPIFSSFSPVPSRPPISAPVAPSGPRFVALCSAPASPTPNLLHLHRICSTYLSHPHGASALLTPTAARQRLLTWCVLKGM